MRGDRATDGVRALPCHTGMEKEEREAHQTVFMSEPGVVTVATIALGMGIDKADVCRIFHTDLPGSVEACYQEFGRTGRDGSPAEAHMLYGLEGIGIAADDPGDRPAAGSYAGRDDRAVSASGGGLSEGLGKPGVRQHCRQSLRK
ncbi:MAG: helicase-related protein [Rhodospirillales bacterium]|nr:helicase-related protein [Rhodospirillales bacterium]